MDVVVAAGRAHPPERHLVGDAAGVVPARRQDAGGVGERTGQYLCAGAADGDERHLVGVGIDSERGEGGRRCCRDAGARRVDDDLNRHRGGGTRAAAASVQVHGRRCRVGAGQGAVAGGAIAWPAHGDPALGGRVGATGDPAEDGAPAPLVPCGGVVAVDVQPDPQVAVGHPRVTAAVVGRVSEGPTRLPDRGRRLRVRWIGRRQEEADAVGPIGCSILIAVEDGVDAVGGRHAESIGDATFLATTVRGEAEGPASGTVGGGSASGDRGLRPISAGRHAGDVGARRSARKHPLGRRRGGAGERLVDENHPGGKGQVRGEGDKSCSQNGGGRQAADEPKDPLRLGPTATLRELSRVVNRHRQQGRRSPVRETGW